MLRQFAGRAKGRAPEDGGEFSGRAALNLVEMQREPVTPASECEAVARLRSAPSEAVTYLNLVGEKSPYYSQIVLVSSPKLVITGTQLAFGRQDGDAKLAFERLEKMLASMNARFDGIVMSHVYLTSSGIIPQLRKVRSGYQAPRTRPPAPCSRSKACRRSTGPSA